MVDLERKVTVNSFINLQGPVIEEEVATHSFSKYKDKVEADGEKGAGSPAERAQELAEDEDDDEGGIEYPEGGLEAYLVVIGSFFSLVIAFGIMNTAGAIQAYLKQHQLAHQNQSSIGWVFSVYYFFSFGGGIYSGAIFDFKGAKIPMVLGTVFLVGGLFASANSKELYQFILSYGVCVGIGTSFLMNASISSVAHWFNKKRGAALGISSFGGGLGGVLWPLMLDRLFPKIGYAWSVRVLAFISLFCLVIGCLLVKSRNSIKLRRSRRRTGRTGPVQFIRDSFVLKELYTDKTYFMLCLAIFLGEFSLILATTYLPSYTIYHGYSENDAFMVLIVYNCVGLPGRYLPNYFGDKFGRFNIMFISVFVSAVLILVNWLPFGSKLGNLYCFSALYGFFSSTILSLTPVCCAQISKTEDFGKRYGTVYFLVSFGNLIALPIGGAIIGDGSGYQALIILAGVTCLASALCWTASRFMCTGLVLRIKF